MDWDSKQVEKGCCPRYKYLISSNMKTLDTIPCNRLLLNFTWKAQPWIPQISANRLDSRKIFSTKILACWQVESMVIPYDCCGVDVQCKIDRRQILTAVAGNRSAPEFFLEKDLESRDRVSQRHSVPLLASRLLQPNELSSASFSCADMYMSLCQPCFTHMETNC